MGRLRFCSAIVVLAAIPAVGFGQDSDANMMRAEAAFFEAVTTADASALGNLLDPDFTWTSAAGRVLKKGQVLAELPKMTITPDATGAAVHGYGVLGVVQVDRGRVHMLLVLAKRPAGWKAVVYQEVMSLPAPPSFTPGAGKDCENPCKTIPFIPQNDTERQVAAAYSKLETAAHARNSAAFGPMVGDEFIAVSSNSDKLQTKRSRMEEFDRAKDGGLAPTPLVSARMHAFGDAVLMISEHKPDRGNPLHVTRLWVKRGGNWVETLSYQTARGQ